MKRMFLAVLVVLMFAQVGFCAIDFTGWKMELIQISKNAEKAVAIINIITPEGKVYGREITWSYSEVSALSLTELTNKLKKQAEYIIEQEYEDYLLKKKASTIIGVKIDLK